MSTVDNPQRETISHSGGGSQTTTIPTRNSNDDIGGEGVVEKRILQVVAHDTSGADNGLVLEEFDPDSNSVVDSMEFELDADADVVQGDLSAAALFSAPRGHRLRVTTEGNAEINLALADERV